MDDSFLELREDDFVVRVRPAVMDSEWTGEVDVAIITSADNNLDDESYSQLMHFTKMMCATVPLMEINEDMRNFVHTYVMEEIDNILESITEEPVVITQEDGNVIRLNFGTRTKGRA